MSHQYRLLRFLPQSRHFSPLWNSRSYSITRLKNAFGSIHRCDFLCGAPVPCSCQTKNMSTQQNSHLLYLNKSQTLKSCPINKAIAALEAFHQKFQARSELNEAQVPPRTIIPTKYGPSLFMPAATEDGHLACKIVHVRSGNKEKNLPTVPGMVLYYNQETGMLKGMLEGSILTCIRTSALSGLATKYLARDDSKVLTVFGAGNEAEWHIRAVKSVRPGIEKVNIINRTVSNAENLASRMREEMPDVTFNVVPSMSKQEAQEEGATTSEGENVTADNDSHILKQTAIKEADIICTCTNASAPVLEGKFISKGTHLNCMGSYTPKMQEIDTETVARADRIYCDASEAIWEEAGDFLHALDDGKMKKEDLLGDMFTVVNQLQKDPKWDRNSKETIRLFKCVGGSLFDTIVAGEAYRNAEEQDLGQKMEL